MGKLFDYECQVTFEQEENSFELFENTATYFHCGHLNSSKGLHLRVYVKFVQTLHLSLAFLCGIHFAVL